MPSYKDQKGNWYCKFYYTDWSGERKQKKKTGFKLKRESEEWERKFLEYHSGSPDMTFEVLSDNYIRMKQIEWKTITWDTKKTIIEAVVLPYFANCKVNEITPIMVKEWQNTIIRERKVQKSTMKNYTSVLSSMMNFAVSYYNLKENPCKSVTLSGSNKKHEMRFLTVDEFKRISELVKDPVKNMALNILFWTGLRKSEVLALTVGDVKPEGLNVNKNLVVVNREVIIQDTIKNDKNRVVGIHPALRSRLTNYINMLQDTSANAPLLPKMTSAIITNALKAACAEANIKPIRVHDLRHSHVAMLIHLGYYPLAIATRIGDSPKTVLTTYSHIYDADNRSMIDQIESLDNAF